MALGQGYENEPAENEKGIPGRRKRMYKGKKIQKGLMGKVSKSEHALWNMSALFVLTHIHSLGE